MSNAVVYVVPTFGDDLGVGIEVGAVLEALYRESSTTSSDTVREVATTARHPNGCCSSTSPASKAR